MQRLSSTPLPPAAASALPERGLALSLVLVLATGGVLPGPVAAEPIPVGGSSEVAGFAFPAMLLGQEQNTALAGQMIPPTTLPDDGRVATVYGQVGLPDNLIVAVVDWTNPSVKAETPGPEAFDRQLAGRPAMLDPDGRSVVVSLDGRYVLAVAPLMELPEDALLSVAGRVLAEIGPALSKLPADAAAPTAPARSAAIVDAARREELATRLSAARSRFETERHHSGLPLALARSLRQILDARPNDREQVRGHVLATRTERSFPQKVSDLYAAENLAASEEALRLILAAAGSRNDWEALRVRADDEQARAQQVLEAELRRHPGTAKELGMELLRVRAPLEVVAGVWQNLRSADPRGALLGIERQRAHALDWQRKSALIATAEADPLAARMLQAAQRPTLDLDELDQLVFEAGQREADLAASRQATETEHQAATVAARSLVEQPATGPSASALGELPRRLEVPGVPVPRATIQLTESWAPGRHLLPVVFPQLATKDELFSLGVGKGDAQVALVVSRSEDPSPLMRCLAVCTIADIVFDQLREGEGGFLVRSAHDRRWWAVRVGEELSAVSGARTTPEAAEEALARLQNADELIPWF